MSLNLLFKPFFVKFMFGHALHEKGLQRRWGAGSRTCLVWIGFRKTNRRRYICQQPGTKSGRRPADKPFINWLSIAGFVPSPVYMGFRLFVLPGGRSGKLFPMPWRAIWTVVFWAKQFIGVPSCRASLRPATLSCAAPPRPARSISGFGIRRVHWLATRNEERSCSRE